MSPVRLIVGIPLVALLALLLRRIAHRIYHRRWRPTGSPIGEIPPPDAPWPDIGRFALGFDGYAACGGTEALGPRANVWRERWASEGALPRDLAELRACLFFEQRRFNHFGYRPEGDDDRYVRALLEAIREETESASGSPAPDPPPTPRPGGEGSVPGHDTDGPHHHRALDQ